MIALEIGHELGVGVPIIATPRLLACSKPRKRLSSRPVAISPRTCRGVWGGGWRRVSPDPWHSFARHLAAEQVKQMPINREK